MRNILLTLLRRKSIESVDSIVGHTMFVDETGTDGDTSKVSYIGCLFDNEGASTIADKIKEFNQRMLDNPRFAGENGRIMFADECRHYVKDHFTVRELFFKEVLNHLPMRIYIVSADYDKATLAETKKKLMNRLIEVARSTRRVAELAVIAEASGSAFDRQFAGVVFKGKDYLPLSVADYVAGGVRECHEIINKVNAGKIPKPRITSFDVQF